MTVIQSQTPGDLTFEARRPTFAVAEALRHDWHGNDPFKTAYFNALSCLFPVGEKYFVDSVRRFRDRIEDPKLLQEVTAFQGQESVHRLEHQRYNELLSAARGYDLEAIEKPLRERLRWVEQNLSPRRQLAGTCAYEHLTAVMADDLLRHRDPLDGADAEISRLWYWHALEETEHKSVAFDVHVAVGGTIGERRAAMFMNTLYFFRDVFRIVYVMLKTNGQHRNIRIWASGMNFLLGRPGVLRRIAGRYLRFYRKRFHPWDEDNRDLVAEWQSRLLAKQS